MFAYPEDLPVEEAKTLVSMLTGNAEKDVKVAAQAAWALQGYLQKTLLGSTSGALMAAESLTTEKEALAYLQGLADGKSPFPHAEGLLDGLLTNPAIIEKIAKLLLPFLAKWALEWLKTGSLDDLLGRLK
jgi:hypothetical protein